MRIEDLTYHLPKGLIAQYPIEPRDKARLLVLKRRGGEMIHTIFSRLGDFLQKGDVLVGNDTRVMPARVCGDKERRGSVWSRGARGLRRGQGSDSHLTSRERWSAMARMGKSGSLSRPRRHLV